MTFYSDINCPSPVIGSPRGVLREGAGGEGKLYRVSVKFPAPMLTRIVSVGPSPSWV